jgi:hypothetical protein
MVGTSGREQLATVGISVRGLAAGGASVEEK